MALIIVEFPCGNMLNTFYISFTDETFDGEILKK